MKVEVVYVSNVSRTFGNVSDFYIEQAEKDRDGNVILGRNARIIQKRVIDDSHVITTDHDMILDHEVLHIVVTDNGVVTIYPNAVRTFTVVAHAEQERVANAKAAVIATLNHRKVTKARHVAREKEKELRQERKSEWLKNNLPTPKE